MAENISMGGENLGVPAVQTDRSDIHMDPPSRTFHHRKRHRHITASDDSDIDSLTEDLDQIGKLSLNLNLSSFNMSNMPSLPNMLSLPKLPNLPTFELSRIQDYSKELSNYISSYVNSTKAKDAVVENDEDYQQVANSIKTAITSRIQMNNLLQDLKVGVSINSAIDRLQPLTDIIHEAISLPVDDISDYEDDFNEEETEPVGVDKIVNSEGPLINYIVKPEETSSNNTKHSSKAFRRWKHRQIFESDDNKNTSDLDNIEGLDEETVRQLTDLSSIDDFAKEDILRSKIQQIREQPNLSQVQKNKLVTRLMMGNYYKYVKNVIPDTNITSKLKSQRLVLQEPSDSTIEEQLDEEDEIAEYPSEDTKDVPNESENENEEDAMEEDVDELNEVFLSENDLQPSYNNPPFNTIFGCQHYQRNCKLECSKCFKWFPCRFCHDQVITDHKMVRNEVKHVLCMSCNTPQEPTSNYCINCELELANYFCEKCVLYDNDTTKDIYHCDKCGICRLGLGIGKDYFHCDKCNICLSIDLREKHKCVANTTHSNCPICNEYLFTSIHKVVFMKCGHTIHQSCYDEMVKHSYKCPVCKKTVVNVETQFRILDREISQEPLPPPYNLWRCIVSCNDCKGKSNVSYHILGLKCKYCKSYNTNQLKLIKPEEEEDDDLEDNEEIEHNFDENVINSVQKNISTNFRIGDRMNTTGISDHGDNDDGYEVDVNDDDEEDEVNSFHGSDTGLQGIIDATKEFGNSDFRVHVGYISSIFQNFVNNATRKDQSRERSISNVSSISREDMIGGF